MARSVARHTPKIAVDYDDGGDVLYLSYGRPVPGYGDTTDDWITLRYSEAEDAPIGATIVGYKSGGFDRRRDYVVHEIAKHLGVNDDEISRPMEGIGL
jgi:hypothetical protein